MLDCNHMHLPWLWLPKLTGLTLQPFHRRLFYHTFGLKYFSHVSSSPCRQMSPSAPTVPNMGGTRRQPSATVWGNNSLYLHKSLVPMLIQFLASLVRLYTCKLLLLALMIFFGGVDTYHQVRAYNSKVTGLSTVTPVYDHYQSELNSNH